MSKLFSNLPTDNDRNRVPLVDYRSKNYHIKVLVPKIKEYMLSLCEKLRV